MHAPLRRWILVIAASGPRRVPATNGAGYNFVTRPARESICLPVSARKGRQQSRPAGGGSGLLYGIGLGWAQMQRKRSLGEGEPHLADFRSGRRMRRIAESQTTPSAILLFCAFCDRF